jgi:hypothetical protein
MVCGLKEVVLAARRHWYTAGVQFEVLRDAAGRGKARWHAASALPWAITSRSDALHADGGPGEVLVDHVRFSPTASKICAPLVAVQRGDAHLGHHLDTPLLMALM